MQYNTIYDLQQAGCQYGWVSIFLALLALYAALAWGGKLRWKTLDKNGRVNSSPRAACLFFSMLTALAFIVSRGEYFTLISGINNHRQMIVEGVISNFKPAVSLKGIESFDLGGHSFTVKKYTLQQGFHLLQQEGSPLQNGVQARLSLVNAHIVKVEVLQHG